jgi:hypothetical protein
MIFVLKNDEKKIFEKKDLIAANVAICSLLLVIVRLTIWFFFNANMMFFFLVFFACKIDLKNYMLFNLFFSSIFILHWNDQTKWFFSQLTHFRFSIDVLQMFLLWEFAQIAQRRLYLHDLFICW